MDIFLFDKDRNSRLVALYQGSKIDDEMMLEWINIEKKGGHLQIIGEEIEAFSTQAKIDIKDIENTNSFLFKMMRIEEEREKTFSSVYDNTFLLKTFLHENSKDGFMHLIKRVHDEVMLFPLSISKEVSFTTDLVSKLFIRDMIPIRIACIAYLLARMNKIVDPEKLSSIILASLIKDLGRNQINRSLFQNLDYFTDDLYHKHPMLSIFLMGKTGFDFSKLTKRLVLEHHEDTEGTGFPRNKKEDNIENLSFFVNISDQLVMLVEGMITGEKVEINKALKMFSLQTTVDNLNTNYPKAIIDTIKSLISIEEQS
jgi:HD-GYP domain-containing protein (c-di-GMP phosphodiesterase class II)